MAEREARWFGRPSVGVPVREVIEGVLNGTYKLEGEPSSFLYDNVDYPITSETALRGLAFQMRSRTHGSRWLEGQLKELGDTPFRGVQIYPRFSGYDEVAFFWGRSEDEAEWRGFVFEPSVVDPETIETLVEKATPDSIDDYEYYIKDIFKYFVGRKKVKTFVSDEMLQYDKEIEDRTFPTEQLISKISDSVELQRERLGDDFSVNAAVHEIALMLTDEGEASGNPQLYAKQFALCWLEMRFVLEKAKRIRQTYLFRNAYEPGSSLDG